jgi:hypothetical protein
MGDYGFDLGSFEDLSFDDYYGGFDLDLGSLPNFGFDIGNIQDLGLGSLDLGGLNFDIGGLDLSGIDLGEMYGDVLKDITPGITGFGEAADQVGGGLGVDFGETYGDVLKDITPGISGFGAAADEVGGGLGIDLGETYGDVLKNISPGIEGFGEAADEVGGSRSGTYIPGIEGFGEAADEVGGSRSGTYIPGIEGFGEAADEVGGSRSGGAGTTTTTKTDTKTDTKKTDTVKEQSELLKTLTSKDNALLMALLGGLLGLLSKGSAPKGPVGYQGGIPKFTSVRGKPGEGTKFIQAAGGGLMDLAQGGRTARYLRGGTDGMADKIKTDIDGKQPARLSHGEFVIPADVVSHLGNGNSDAGADVLYDMMDKIRKARTGTTKQGKQINPRQYTPA